MAPCLDSLICHVKFKYINLVYQYTVEWNFDLCSALLASPPDASCQCCAEASCVSQQTQLKVLSAHNDSALVARLHSCSATELPRENTVLAEIAAIMSLATLFG
jgi:hypothetical protein